jgi:uncharacterized protein
MTSRVPQRRALVRADFGSPAQGFGGARQADTKRLRRVRIAFALGLGAIATAAFAATDAPSPQADKSGDAASVPAHSHRGGVYQRVMVRYTKPVFHNGHIVLWHGAWRDGVGRTVFHPRPGTASPQAAPAAAADASSGVRQYSIIADPGDPSATRLADELAAAMSSDDAPVKVVEAATSRSAIAKALSADSADFALAPLDSLADPAQASADWRRRAPFVARLCNEDVELLTARSVTDVRQLAGRKVNVGGSDSAAAASASVIFSHLNVAANWTNYPLPDALQRLSRGEIDAVLVVGGKNADALQAFDGGVRFHFASLPYPPALRAYYLPKRLTKSDFPKLIGATEKVETLSTPMALLALDGGAPQRAERLAAPATKLLANFDQLLDDAKDPRWREVNLAASIDQLPRFAAAQAWLDQNKTETGGADLEAFRAAARTANASSDGPSGADSDRLYQSLIRLTGAGQ